MDMNWDYIAGFFDGEGNMHINIIPTKSYQIVCRLYSSNKDILIKIQNFIGYGKIYQKKSNQVFELTIMKKQNCLSFLNNIKDKIVIKKPQLDYLLSRFDFRRGMNNQSFEITQFRSFVTRRGVEGYRTAKLLEVQNDS